VTTDKDPSVFRRLDRDRLAEPRWRLGRLGAVALGIVAVGLTLGVAELVAQLGNWFGVFHLTASPFSALGATFIYFTPEWLKEFGIRLFGQSDKVALAVSMTGTFLILGAVIGLVGRRRPRWAVGIAVVLIVITGVAVITRPNSTVADLIPTVIGGLVGVWFLVTGLRVALLDPRTGVAPAATSEARADTSADAAETRDATPGTPKAAASKAASSKTAASKTGASNSSGATAAGTAGGSGSVDRRHFLRFAGIGALAAAAAGILSRWVPSTADVEASRAAVTLPTVSDSQPPVVSQSSGGGATPSGTGSGSAPATTATTGSATGGATGGGSTGTSPGTVSGQGAPVDVNPPVPGITPYVTSAGDFYRVDTAFVVPRVTTDAWKLKIHGLVDNPFEITFADLLALPQIERMVTLTCVSNEVGGPLAGNAAWQGVRVADLLAKAKPQPTADCVYSSSADGFTVTTPLAVLTDGRDAMLAIGMNGAPLPLEHGFPVRMVVPGLYGYVSATKWVVDLELTTFSEVTAYWTERGWAPQAPIKTASRIDVPKLGADISPGAVPVAGVAWAQHRGISKVEVQVDDGPWAAAVLSGTVSADTWRQWVYTWQATSGKHLLRVRATDGTGALQTAAVHDVIPDGATGYHTVEVKVS
jgi:DMSO/TMAO reductase YedYZ molybdopterin-dependent catalytic subunit